jgi:RHS repeat-associated protein
VVRKGTGTSGTIYYYHRNQQYSIYAITTSAGAVTERYAYTAYGQPTVLNASANVISASAIGNRYSYTGREWDATIGLHHFRARWMSGMSGRFLGRDPLGYWSSVSMPIYCDNDPLTLVDPIGLDWLDDMANFSAGISDSLTMSGTSWVREWTGINDGIEVEDGWYITGELTEITVEVTLTMGAGASRHIAKHAVRRTLEGSARRTAATAYKRTYKVESVIVHHATPIKGHIGGIPSYFPLPYKFAAQGKWNFQYLSNVAEHAAMHRRLRRQEWWLKQFNFSQPVRNGTNLAIQHWLEIDPNIGNGGDLFLPSVSTEMKLFGEKTIYYDSCDPRPDSFGYSAEGLYKDSHIEIIFRQ